MGKLKNYAVGTCCVRCKTSSEICAKKFACSHHLKSMNTIAERHFESRMALVGEDDAISEFIPGRMAAFVKGHLVDALVDEADSDEWARRQVFELGNKYPQLSESSFIERFMDKAFNILANEQTEVNHDNESR